MCIFLLIVTVTMIALQIQDRSQISRPVLSLNQSQTQMTRPVGTGLGMQRALQLTVIRELTFLLCTFVLLPILCRHSDGI